VLAPRDQIAENYQRMGQNGVTIDSSPAPSVVEALRTSAATVQRAWCTRSGSICGQILDAYRAGKP